MRIFAFLMRKFLPVILMRLMPSMIRLIKAMLRR